MDWKILASTIVSALMVASCLGSERTGSRAPAFAAAGTHSPSDPSPAPGGPVPGALASGSANAVPPGGAGWAPAAPRGGRRVSLRPRNNASAHDLLDHWSHRGNGMLSELLSQPSDPAALRDKVAAARRRGPENFVPGLRDGDAVTALGGRRDVDYGRWSGGPADTLSIDFDLTYATAAMRGDRAFTAALERAGKVWSRRIADTWGEWRRSAGGSKGRLVGNRGSSGRELRVGPGGETSTGLVIFITGVNGAGDAAGWGGPSVVRPGAGWEPHTGAIGLVRDHVEKAGEATLFGTMVHEIGHVLGAWLGGDATAPYAPFADAVSGAWTGPNVVAVHGRPAPFQDARDTHGWHHGERSPGAGEFDFAHSGVCASAMAYCGQSAGVPPFLPAEIDFAFLADLGLTVTPETDRPETYGLAGWMDHSAFTLSVSRSLEVSLADPQPRYSIGGAGWQGLETVDLLWAGADAFGAPSAGVLAASFPRAGTVRWSGGLIGAAVRHDGLPPVYGDADLSIRLDSLAGKADFTSLRTVYDGKRYRFGGGSLHYPIAVVNNAIAHRSPGVWLVADFYGPGHAEVAGTLEDSRAGLVASFGATRDERPSRPEVIAGADHVRGLAKRHGFDEGADGWRRFRCGAGSGCDGRFEWWKPGSDWYAVAASGGRSPRERVLDWTAGWGDWLSEDMFADRGGIAIARRHARATDGGRGRYQTDGYYGTMEHAAFGVGFAGFRDWAGDGGVSNSSVLGAGFQGSLTGARPPGGAVWSGRMVGFQEGIEGGQDPFVQGHAGAAVSFQGNRLDILFSAVTSMDFKRTLEDFGFENIPLASDGSFDGFDGGQVEGALFGPAHGELAGMFHKNGNRVTGAFGAVREDAAATSASRR